MELWSCEESGRLFNVEPPQREEMDLSLFINKKTFDLLIVVTFTERANVLIIVLYSHPSMIKIICFF